MTTKQMILGAFLLFAALVGYKVVSDELDTRRAERIFAAASNPAWSNEQIDQYIRNHK